MPPTHDLFRVDGNYTGVVIIDEGGSVRVPNTPAQAEFENVLARYVNGTTPCIRMSGPVTEAQGYPADFIAHFRTESYPIVFYAVKKQNDLTYTILRHDQRTEGAFHSFLHALTPHKRGETEHSASNVAVPSTMATPVLTGEPVDLDSISRRVDALGERLRHLSGTVKLKCTAGTSGTSGTSGQAEGTNQTFDCTREEEVQGTSNE